ncbi:MAG: hypothetical protein LBS54_06950 [Dysgonamonadaceae bacterium]|jgi:hypothetical protein|nr:hypothetical protein [Dysgonamonadaceae bacterium]
MRVYNIKSSQTGFKFSETGFKFSETGFKFSQTGFKFSETGFNFSQTGFKFSQTGFKFPQTGFKFSETGDKFPKKSNKPIVINMKKFMFIAVLTLLVMSGGCSDKNEYYEYNFESKTITYTVKSSDWHEGNDNVMPYLYYTFDEPAMTNTVVNKGIVTAFMIINGNLTPLPYEDFRMEESGYKYTEQVTCEFKQGEVTFIFKTSDHILRPEFDYDFVIKMMW